MNDQEFLKAFETCTLPNHLFPHRAHIRMAWLYLRAGDFDTGMTHIRDGIQRFANVQGHAPKYHETITVFWARLVNAAIQASPDIDAFETFAQRHPELLDSHLIQQFYTTAVLHNAVARQQWVEPDLKPLPR